MVMAVVVVALASVPDWVAAVAPASVPLVVALGVLVSEVDGELDVVEELSLLVPDGMLLLLVLLLSLGWLVVAPALVSLGWLLDEPAWA